MYNRYSKKYNHKHYPFYCKIKTFRSERIRKICFHSYVVQTPTLNIHFHVKKIIQIITTIIEIQLI